MLAIAKKTLDKNRFTATQKTLARDKPAFQIGDCVYFKNKQPGKWDLKWRPGYRIVHIESDGHFIHIENQTTGKIQSCNVKDIILEPPIEFWKIDTQFGRVLCNPKFVSKNNQYFSLSSTYFLYPIASLPKMVK